MFPKGEAQDYSHPKCKTPEELARFITELASVASGYNQTGYSVARALLATEHLMAHMLGTTGFQHEYARLAFLQESMHSKTGIAIIDFDQLMYPQYDIVEKVTKWIEEQKKSKGFKKAVRELIREDDSGENFMRACPDVREHWESLVK